MKTGLEFGKRACRIVHQIHRDMASKNGCISKNGVKEDEFRKCLEKITQ
jgi:hypothetical protein